MNTFFHMDATRKIFAAYENKYAIGTCHSDRILKEHDFVYILDGEWTIDQNGISYPLKKDDVILLTAKEHHGGTIPCINGTKTLFLHTEAFEDERLTEDVQTGGNQIPLPIVIHCQDNYKIKEIYYNMISTFAINAPYQAQRLDTLFRMLLLQLYDTAYNNLKANFGTSNMVNEILYLIHCNPHRFYTDSELSKLFFANEKTIANKFRLHTGLTPYRYQMHYKLENIKAILKNEPEQTLKSLSLEFGFYDEFHLSRCFKEHYGISPTQFKKSCKLQ